MKKNSKTEEELMVEMASELAQYQGNTMGVHLPFGDPYTNLYMGSLMTHQFIELGKKAAKRK